jgi:hypothetical protein
MYEVFPATAEQLWFLRAGFVDVRLHAIHSLTIFTFVSFMKRSGRVGCLQRLAIEGGGVIKGGSRTSSSPSAWFDSEESVWPGVLCFLFRISRMRREKCVGRSWFVLLLAFGIGGMVEEVGDVQMPVAMRETTTISPQIRFFFSIHALEEAKIKIILLDGRIAWMIGVERRRRAC